MAKSKKKVEALPVRSGAQIKEAISKMVFSDLIHPWMVRYWEQDDFGIDANVEITKSIINTKDQIVSGKRFSVQLKASEKKPNKSGAFSISIPVNKINYWYNSIEPVLIAYFDTNGGKFYYKWVDEHLINDLFDKSNSWVSQESVTIEFDPARTIVKGNLLEIEKYLLHWKRPLNTILIPGEYFKYNEELNQLCEHQKQLLDKYQISHLRNEVDDLSVKVSKAIYTIAIAGPSRAGKSTLINALLGLKREISPIGILPTTGVPITIFPGEENISEIVFKDGTKKTGPIDSSFLKEYTSQDENPDNEKQVKLVSVKVVNEKLEKGIALCDVPGLDDPDEQIRAITQTTLLNVNAIIYVINTASMADGGFSFTKQTVDDLRHLGSRMDRLFLVFNKIDLLNNEQLELLKSYVEKMLERHDIAKHLPVPPFYISAQKSYQPQTNEEKEKGGVPALENEMWSYFLTQNKIGLHKLLSGYASFTELSGKLKNVLSTRLLSTSKRTEVEKEIEQVNDQLATIQQNFDYRKQNIYVELKQQLKVSLKNITDYMEQELRGVTHEKDIPGQQQITDWLVRNAYEAISDIYYHLDNKLSGLQSEVNHWIANQLKQVEMSIHDQEAPDNFQLPNMEEFTGIINDSFAEKSATSDGILENMIIFPVFNFFSWIWNGLERIFSSEESLKKKHINTILKKSREAYTRINNEFLSKLNYHVNKACDKMLSKSTDRAQVYLGELNKQLRELEKPLSKQERQNIQGFMNELTVHEQTAQSSFNHLKVYTDGITR